MSSANLDDVLEVDRFLSQHFSEALEVWNQELIHLCHCSDMHDSGESVVGTLASVAVVVGVDHFGAQFASEDLDCSIGNDLVGVHVGLSSGACLPHNEWEVIIMLSLSDLVCCLNDGLADLWVQAELKVCLGSCFLQHSEGPHDWKRHSFSLASDLEVHERPLGLSTPVSVGRHLKLSEGVGLCSEFFLHAEGSLSGLN